MNTVLGSGAVCGRRKIFFPASAMELVFLVVHQHREQRGVQEGRERGGCGEHDGCTIKRAHHLKTGETLSRPFAKDACLSSEFSLALE